MNYIDALYNYLRHDNEVNAIVGERIAFARVDSTMQKPYIIFNEQARESEHLDSEDYKAGIDIFPVLIDVVVDYQDTAIGRELRQLIRKKIGSYNGVLWRDNEDVIIREGVIQFMRFMACDYNPAIDGVLWGGLYLFKHYYDHKN